MEPQKAWKAEAISSKKVKTGDITIPDFEL